MPAHQALAPARHPHISCTAPVVTDHPRSNRSCLRKSVAKVSQCAVAFHGQAMAAVLALGLGLHPQPAHALDAYRGDERCEDEHITDCPTTFPMSTPLMLVFTGRRKTIVHRLNSEQLAQLFERVLLSTSSTAGEELADVLVQSQLPAPALSAAATAPTRPSIPRAAVATSPLLPLPTPPAAPGLLAPLQGTPPAAVQPGNQLEELPAPEASKDQSSRVLGSRPWSLPAPRPARPPAALLVQPPPPPPDRHGENAREVEAQLSEGVRSFASVLGVVDLETDNAAVQQERRSAGQGGEEVQLHGAVQGEEEADEEADVDVDITRSLLSSLQASPGLLPPMPAADSLADPTSASISGTAAGPVDAASSGSDSSPQSSRGSGRQGLGEEGAEAGLGAGIEGAFATANLLQRQLAKAGAAASSLLPPAPSLPSFPSLPALPSLNADFFTSPVDSLVTQGEAALERLREAGEASRQAAHEAVGAVGQALGGAVGAAGTAVAAVVGGAGPGDWELDPRLSAALSIAGVGLGVTALAVAAGLFDEEDEAAAAPDPAAASLEDNPAGSGPVAAAGAGGAAGGQQASPRGPEAAPGAGAGVGLAMEAVAAVQAVVAKPASGQPGSGEPQPAAKGQGSGTPSAGLVPAQATQAESGLALAATAGASEAGAAVGSTRAREGAAVGNGSMVSTGTAGAVSPASNVEAGAVADPPSSQPASSPLLPPLRSGSADRPSPAVSRLSPASAARLQHLLDNGPEQLEQPLSHPRPLPAGFPGTGAWAAAGGAAAGRQGSGQGWSRVSGAQGAGEGQQGSEGTAGPGAQLPGAILWQRPAQPVDPVSAASGRQTAQASTNTTAPAPRILWERSSVGPSSALATSSATDSMPDALPDSTKRRNGLKEEAPRLPAHEPGTAQRPAMPPDPWATPVSGSTVMPKPAVASTKLKQGRTDSISPWD
ncbi:hypothetical protein QJQ45_023809 [Haematococcus lacustris]|nr:hypothetical protein QJQ45_023809 [Haematococcus lacustris]